MQRGEEINSVWNIWVWRINETTNKNAHRVRLWIWSSIKKYKLEIKIKKSSIHLPSDCCQETRWDCLGKMSSIRSTSRTQGTPENTNILRTDRKEKAENFYEETAKEIRKKPKRTCCQKNSPHLASRRKVVINQQWQILKHFKRPKELNFFSKMTDN